MDDALEFVTIGGKVARDVSTFMTHNNGVIRILIIFFSGLLATGVFAADKILDVNPIMPPSISLTEYFAVLEDADKSLTISDAQLPSIANRFQGNQSSSEALFFNYSQSAYWLRFTLRNSENYPLERLLEIREARLSNVQFYQPETEHHYSVITTGRAFPFSTRVYKNHFFVFPVTLPANSQQTYYFRIQSKTTLLVPAKLWIPQAFRVHERNDYSVQAWYFGMVSAMVFFNLLLFLLLKDRVYLLYSCSTLSIALVTAGINGLFKEFIAPNSLFWVDKTVPYLTACSTIMFLLFMRSILNTKHIIPRIDGLLKLMIGIHVVIVLALTFIPLQVPVKPLIPLYLMTPLFVLAVCVQCILKRQRSAYFFSIAFFAFLVSAVITQMQNTGFLPTNFFTIYGVQIGSALEMQLMAIALADRFNSMRKEKEQTQQELLVTQQSLLQTLRESETILEQRVIERTHALQLANKKLAALSMTDGLTGIANRRHFDEMLLVEWTRMQRQQQPLAIGFLDVDWFKKYNDHYGHQMGDECLKKVARILAENICRTGDLVARYGGEEFVFLAPVTDAKMALTMAQKLCCAFQTIELAHELSEFGNVTVSIGVAAIVPNAQLKPDDLLKAADEALYQAKKLGRNQVAMSNLV